MGTRTQGHRQGEVEKSNNLHHLFAISPNLELVSRPSLLLLNTSGAVVLRQEVSELLVGRLGEDSLLPEVGGEVTVGLGNGGVGCLGKVSKSSSGALGRGVAILNSSHLEELLGDRSRDNASSTRGGDQPHPNAAALPGHLAGHGVGFAKLGSPETTPHGNDGELRHDDGARMAVATSLLHFTPSPTWPL